MAAAVTVVAAKWQLAVEGHRPLCLTWHTGLKQTTLNNIRLRTQPTKELTGLGREARLEYHKTLLTHLPVRPNTFGPLNGDVWLFGSRRAEEDKLMFRIWPLRSH